MTQPAVIFSNYDGAHTADRAANNTCVAKVKRQAEWVREREGSCRQAAEVCCLSLLFWVKICDAQQQQQQQTATTNIASNQNLNTELTKNPKNCTNFWASGTFLFILIIFRFFFAFYLFGVFVLPLQGSANKARPSQSQSAESAFHWENSRRHFTPKLGKVPQS